MEASSSRGRGGRRGGAVRGGHLQTHTSPETLSAAAPVMAGSRSAGPAPSSNPPVDVSQKLQKMTRGPQPTHTSPETLSAAAPVMAGSRPAGPAPSSNPPVPDSQKLQNMILSAPVGSSSKAMQHPRRPGPGTIGRKCAVLANHFKVVVPKNMVINHYDVSMTPEVKSVARTRKVMSELVKSYGPRYLGNRLPAYDGRKSLFTVGELPFSSKEFEVKFFDDDGSLKRERCYKVSIKFASTADVHHLMRFLCGQQRDLPQETVQALDVVLRATPSEALIPLGRSFFSRDYGGAPLGDGAVCWKGYFQSLRATQMGLSLNIDATATAFVEPILAVEFIKKVVRVSDSRAFDEVQHRKIGKAIAKLKVEVIYGKTPRRRYLIKGLTKERLRTLTFDDEQGAKMTVIKYFSTKYEMQLKLVEWPALVAGDVKRPIYLPIEACTIVDGQKYRRKLTENQVTNMLKAACQRPAERERFVSQVVNSNQYHKDKYAREFSLQVSDQLAVCHARVLPPPCLKYHDSGKDKQCLPNLGQWNMIGKKVVNGGYVEHWACINFSQEDIRATQSFCNELVKMCVNMGMEFETKPVITTRACNPGSLERELLKLQREVGEHLSGKKDARLQLLVVILPEITGSVYGRVKRVCETQLDIVSQCCKPRNVRRISNQYLENVALKINVKVGGRNSVLMDALYKRVPIVTTDLPTIIFGADVTHPPAGEDSSPSIAAVVASQDWPQITKYCGLVSAQAHRKEIIADLYNDDPARRRSMIRELLFSFYRATKQKPARILFYRDGVSEGQFAQVLAEEMQAIWKACASIEEGYLPRVTFVVVQKRHHTRLFAANKSREYTDRSGNILPGTIVDTQICHPTEFDFYLCSHAGIQGTSRPVHYHVLFDENGFTADQLQTLTNNLCYTYARCTRSVSVAPPVYYAHLMAFRARYYMDADASDSGSESGSTASGTSFKQLPALTPNVKQVMFYC